LNQRLPSATTWNHLSGGLSRPFRRIAQLCGNEDFRHVYRYGHRRIGYPQRPWLGHGFRDKAPYKAMTGALKYSLRMNGLIPDERTQRMTRPRITRTAQAKIFSARARRLRLASRQAESRSLTRMVCRLLCDSRSPCAKASIEVVSGVRLEFHAAKGYMPFAWMQAGQGRTQ